MAFLGATTTLSPTSIALSWTATPGFLSEGSNGDGYIVKYRLKGDTQWHPVSTVPTTDAAFTLVNLYPTSRYDIQITSVLSAGSITFSNVPTTIISVPPPVNVYAPAIQGTAAVGQVLSLAHTGVYYYNYGITLAYRWWKGDPADTFGGPTYVPLTAQSGVASPYTIVAGDRGYEIVLAERPTGLGGTATTFTPSAPTSVVV